MAKEEQLNKLYKLYKGALVPAPDSSGGGSEVLQGIFLDIVQCDSFVSGLIGSFLRHGKVAVRKDVLAGAIADLSDITRMLERFTPGSKGEESYWEKYKEWATSLLRMAKTLEDCLAAKRH